MYLDIMEKLLFSLQENRMKQKNEKFKSWLKRKTNTDEHTLSFQDIISNYIFELKIFLNNKVQN